MQAPPSIEDYQWGRDVSKLTDEDIRFELRTLDIALKHMFVSSPGNTHVRMNDLKRELTINRGKTLDSRRTTYVVARVYEMSETASTVLVIEHDYEMVGDMLQAIRNTVRKWLTETEAGKNALEGTFDDFNWGDLAVYNVPLPEGVNIKAIESATEIDHDERLAKQGGDELE